ncbi:MAG: glycoside hydrolase family 30 beta sandwich domain-containing protein [Rikenellaceae bacterium]
MKKNYLKLAVTAIAAVISVASYAQKPQMIYTTESERWITAKKGVTVAPASGDADITVYTDKTRQTVDGVGGAFNEMGWDALQLLPQAEQDKVLKNLFSKEGCGFSMGRISVGANDYSLSYYSCCDVKEDFVMRDFNIDRDRYITIPYLKAAKALNPEIKIWASPWTPPAWMKINEHYSTRGGNWNGRKEGNEMPAGADLFNNCTGFNMQERYLQAYALYFSKFAQSYKAEGVPLVAIMPQNEIAYSPNWPSCTWRPEDMAYFIGKFMGPQFEKDGLDTDIWLGTINFANPSYCETVLKDKNAQKYIKGIGFQWAGERALPKLYEKYPNMKFMQTENKCGESENDWSSLVRSWGSIMHYMNNGCESYLYWNMILKSANGMTGKSAWGWPQNSMVVIDEDSKKVTYTDEFYLFKHFSHFVQPGSQYLESSKGENHVAFKMVDGRTLVMVYNPETEAKTVKIQIGDKMVTATLQPTSINSITL